MVTASDPVGQGFIQSFARPGGNITGNSSQGEETIAKTFELFSEMLPAEASIAVLYNSSSSAHARFWSVLETSARALRRKLVRLDVSSAAQYPAAFEKLVLERAGGLQVLPDDHLFINTREELLALVRKHGVPAAFHDRQFVAEGALMSYGASLDWGYSSAAGYVDKLLKGATPAALPVERPNQFRFVLNLNVAKSLGVVVPPALLLRADEVIH